MRIICSCIRNVSRSLRVFNADNLLRAPFEELFGVVAGSTG